MAVLASCINEKKYLHTEIHVKDAHEVLTKKDNEILEGALGTFSIFSPRKGACNDYSCLEAETGGAYEVIHVL